MEKGQSLIEVLVGLATASIIVGAITVATLSSLNNAVFSKNQNLATQYAQQGVEIVRSVRDRNYSQFEQLVGTSSATTYCLAKSCTTINPPSASQSDPCGPMYLQCQQNVGGENADTFVRQVRIDPNSTDCADGAQQQTQATGVTVNVSWYDAKCPTTNLFCHTASLSTCLSTYNVITQ